MSETRDIAPGDDQIRNDYLAGRGAAPQSQMASAWQGLLATPQPAPAPPPAPQEDLPLGKRLLSGVGHFAYGLVKPFFEDPSFLQKSAQEQQLVSEKEQELGRPLTLRERLDLVPIMESAGGQAGLGLAGGGVGKGAAEAAGAKPLEGIAGEAAGTLPETIGTKPIAPGEPPSLNERLQSQLGNVAPTPEEKPEGAATAPISRGPQGDFLQLGDPLEPAITLRTNTQLAAQADVTLGRMAQEGSTTRVTGVPLETPDASPKVAGEAPIGRFRKDAALIESRLLPPADGLTRLWRGNRPGEIGSAQQFTNDLPGIALPFREPYGGDVSYVDIPTDDLEKYENKIGGAPGAEFYLPPELAQQAKATGWARPAMPEPALADGMTRLYRGETGLLPGETPAAVPDWLKQSPEYQSMLDATGRWFSASRQEAEHYASEQGQGPPGGGSVSYVDVPSGDAEKYLSKNQPEAKAFSAAGRENEEYFLPKDLAASRQVMAPLPETEPTLMSAETIHAYLAGARVDNPIKVNLGRIGSNEDIADALAQVSKTIPEQAVQSNEATAYAADALGLSPSDFLRNYQGQQLNAAETTAMRFTLDSSASQLVDFAKAAREPLAPPEAHAQFLKAFTVHRSLQQYFENARAEAGRTLQSWQIMSQQRSAATRAIGDLIKNVDRNGDLSDLAENIADMDNPLHVNRLVAASMQGSGRDTLMKIMYNIRLSSPTTLAKKIASDVTMPFWNAATRYTAERLGSSGAVIPGETGSLIGGYIGSFTDALRAGGKAIKAGESQFWQDYHTMDTLDLSQGYGGTPQAQATRVGQRFRLSALANGVPEPVELDQPTRGMLGYLQSAMPTSWIGGVDDFAKVWQYRANLRALAWRQAEGNETEFQRLLDNVPQGLHQQAVSAALKYTFQEPLTGAFADMRNFLDKLNIHVPTPRGGFDFPVGRLIVPFVKVPANIERMAYRASPLSYMVRSPQIRAALANPGADRDILMAEMGLGTAMATGTLAYALNGYITGKGPTDPALNREWRAAGNQPYSVQVPGARPFTYNWFEPHGTVMAGIADTANLMKFAKDEDNQTLALSAAFGVGQALLSKTYFQSASDFLDALAHPDQDSGRFTSRLIASFVPQGLQHVGEALDDWRRAHYGIMDNIEANTPVVREGLPAAQTFWGDPIPAREAYLPFMSGKAAGIVSPATLGPAPESVEPIDKWIYENRESFPNEMQTERGMMQPGRTLSYRGGAGIDARVKLEPGEYARYKELAGNGLKDEDGLGAKDGLNALVTGTHPSPSKQQSWDDASPAGKALMVRTAVTKFRSGAKQQMLQEFPEIADAMKQSLGEKSEALQAR